MTNIDYGALTPIVENEKFVRITVNRPDVVHVWHYDEGLQDHPLDFADDEAVHAVAEQIAASVDMPFNYQHPIAEVRLADGARALLINRHVSSGGTVIHIEKAYDAKLTTDILVEINALSQPAADFLDVCVRGHARIGFVGGHHSGRKAGMNAIVRIIPEVAPTVIIQPFNTIQLPDHSNVVKLESQRARFMNVEHLDNGALLDAALRLMPHRLIIAEIDGTEVSSMLTAMQDSLDTFFGMAAASPKDALRKLERMAVSQNLSSPVLAIREQIVDSIDLLVHVDLMTDGFQRFISIDAVEGMAGDAITLVPIFERAQGLAGGDLVATGHLPHSTIERLALYGFDVDEAWFKTP